MDNLYNPPVTHFAIYNAQRDMSLATADLVVTGIGFRPRRIKLNMWVNAAGKIMSLGYALSPTNQICLYADNTGGQYEDTGSLGEFVSGATPDRQLVTLKSFDADGFTLTFTKQNSPAGTANLLAEVMA